MQLFLSFNSADRTSVIAVQKLLQARDISTFLDRDNLVSGLAWPQVLEQALKAVDGVAVFIGCELWRMAKARDVVSTGPAGARREGRPRFPRDSRATAGC
jgi:hypothetical protein